MHLIKDNIWVKDTYVKNQVPECLLWLQVEHNHSNTNRKTHICLLFGRFPWLCPFLPCLYCQHWNNESNQVIINTISCCYSFNHQSFHQRGITICGSTGVNKHKLLIAVAGCLNLTGYTSPSESFVKWPGRLVCLTPATLVKLAANNNVVLLISNDTPFIHLHSKSKCSYQN